MPVGLQVSIFNHWYPGLWSSPYYSTRDHIIPYPHFVFYYQAMLRNIAYFKHNLGQGVALGNAIANCGPDSRDQVEDASRAMWDYSLGKS